MFDQWYLDLWATMFLGMSAFAALFALIGIGVVAFEGRSGWPKELTTVVVGLPLVGLLFPLIVLIPFIALYRAVRNK